MSSTSTMERTPLVISAGDLVVGPVHASFRDDDPRSLLHNYLVLIRQLRGQQREQRLTLRGEDISALADHLDTTETEVLGDLLDLMGATRAQRKALFSLFAAGALIIVATGSVALNLSSDGAAAELAPVDPVAAAAPEAPAVTPTTMIETPTVEPEESVLEPVMAIAYGGTEWTAAVELSTFVAAIATTADDEVVTSATPSPSPGQGVADDGSTVAVGPPPVPPVEGVGIADDGSTVAVAPPPVPPVEGVGIADDGSTVAVAPPPVP